MKESTLGLLVFALSLMLIAPAPTQSQTRKSPEAVAQAFYQAWRVKNRRAGLKLAGKPAVNKLFGTRWRAMQFQGCTHRDEGGYECIYLDSKLDLSIAFILNGGASARSYSILSVSFSSEG